MFGLVGLVYWGLTQQPGSYQGGEMMMKPVFWWRKPEYPEETTDLRQVTDVQSHTCQLIRIVRKSYGFSPILIAYGRTPKIIRIINTQTAEQI